MLTVLQHAGDSYLQAIHRLLGRRRRQAGVSVWFFPKDGEKSRYLSGREDGLYGSGELVPILSEYTVVLP